MIPLPLYTLFGCCLVSICLGHFGSAIIRGLRGTTNKKAMSEAAPEQQSSQKGKQLDSLIRSLYDLTSQVDLQVGQYSVRVGEITDSLESPGEIGSAMVLVAGKLLITANQQLQADLKEAKSEIQRQREQMSSCMLESRTDALTGLPNRRAFDHEIQRVFAQRRRDGQPFSLLMVDIDHFKQFNDQHGHMVGDQLLKCFARCLTNTFRESDFIARFGGEEFAAILPTTTLDEAIRAAERVRQAIADDRYNVGDLELRLTASIGIKEVHDGEIDADVIQRADEALYGAKRGGRNRCCYYDGTKFQSCSHEAVTAPDVRENPSTATDGSLPEYHSTLTHDTLPYCVTETVSACA
jgi:diguanylate cyclase